jgi:AcrR family transcriptional regulator
MQQAERSERSRTQILEAALRLFSARGYRGTSIRDIAEAAGVSTGNLYHQFPDKETIFQSLLQEYWTAIASPDFPLTKAMVDGAFPEDLEALGRAARDSVAQWKQHVALIYVDVVEFNGSHIRRFYSEMAKRYQAFLDGHPRRQELLAQLRPEVSPLSAIMFATRMLLNYYAVEIVFGVPNHFGKDSDEVLHEFADILKFGMLRPDAATRRVPRVARSSRP